MARTSKLKTTNVRGIPIQVVLRSTPCLWEIKPHPTGFRVLDVKSGRVRRIRIHPEFFYERESDSLGEAYFDPWSVREVFLSLRTKQQFLDFLNEIGRFAPQIGVQHSEGWALMAFQSWQQVLEDLLRHSPATWSKTVRKVVLEEDQAELVESVLNYADTLPIRFHWEGEQHYAIMEARDVVTAVVATIYVDHLRDARFDFCARPDCRRAFQVTSKHKRKYCTQYCAHLESLRRMRARQKRKRQKPADAPST